MQNQDNVPATNIDSGTGYCFFALRVGDYVDLEKVSTLTRESDCQVVHDAIPPFFKDPIRPLILVKTIAKRTFGKFETAADVGFAVYPFGVVSVRFAIPLQGVLSDLVELSRELEASIELETLARELVVEFIEGLHVTIADMRISNQLEDYWVFCLPKNADVELLARAEGGLVAQILNGEQATLSGQVVSKVVDGVIAYTPNVGIFTDWAAALVIDSNPFDVLAVVEVANAMSVVLDFVDAHLDATLVELKGVRTNKVMGIPEVRAAKGLHAEYALMLSLLSEPLKLVQDQYLARVFERLSSLHHNKRLDSIRESFAAINAHWEAAVEDRNASSSRWAEHFIILLIIIEIVLALFLHYS